MKYYIYDKDSCEIMHTTGYFPSMDIRMVLDHSWAGEGYLPNWAKSIENIDEHELLVASAPKFVSATAAIKIDAFRRRINRFMSSHHFGHDKHGHKISLSNWKSFLLSWAFLLGLVAAVIWMFATAGIAHGIVCAIIAAIAFGCAYNM